jgi:adenylate kinase
VSDVILLGPPGAGKGTQAARLADKYQWVHVSTGDLFRDHLRRRTSLGTLAQSYMDRGELVPDEVAVRMVRERLSEVPTGTRVIFDGFPRTVPQAVSLRSLLDEKGRALDRVVLILVPLRHLLSRVAKRATCPNCQAVYNTDTNPPKKAGICDRCGSPIPAASRPDDAAPDVVRTRLAVYEAETAPLVAHYQAQGVLATVDGNGFPDEVGARIEQALA